MKLFRKLFLVIPLLFSISACSGKETAAGTYSFQLGKEDGSRAAIHITLSDDLAEDVEVEGYEPKKFSIQFELGASSQGGVLGILSHLDTIVAYIEAHGFDLDAIEKLVEQIEEEAKKRGGQEIPVNFDGYYYLVDSVNQKGKEESRLMMGINFNFLTTVDVPPEIVEKVIYAVYKGDSIDVVIPVSITDLLYQIYWYGYRIASLESLLKPVDLSKEVSFLHHNPIGFHPSDEEINDIKVYQNQREEKYEAGELDSYEAGEFIYNSYYGYNTLTMGLLKDGK